MRSTGKIALLALIAVQAASCGPTALQRADSRFPLRVDGHPMVEVRVEVSPQLARQVPHWIEGARWAVYHHLRILGRAPATTITVVDRRVGARAEPAPPGVIQVTAPFLASDRGRQIEAAIAREVGRAFWQAALQCDDSDGLFLEGLARYTATIALVAQYDGLRVPPAVGMFEQRWLGGLLPWVIRFEMPAWTAPPHRDDEALAARSALAMQTLASWVGTPTFEAALRTLATAPRRGCASWRDLQSAATDVTGLDLSWFFEPAFAMPRVFDYGIEELESDPAPADAARFATRVVARRYGDAQFTGTSERPIEPFEAGRGVELRVRFADGTERIDYWDGRAERRVFEYDSASRAVSAVIDPRGIILLDVNRTNNSRTLSPRARTAATKWSMTWVRWLQDMLLSYASLV